ncbi:copper chaperone PCu(A)C [Maliponia aquimaris]|uniref:Copper chaperone PCu(A)C n=1 Tax=Maliponia aquimaris TaxID=1673631 RepID=A0A238JRP5_9RHOB|nr:copper chaperone PCu(A)C [Maliponia aquimaris]SMX33235.1 hypothetical protein MAA8898_00424 [Maliponia aquimaris]
MKRLLSALILCAAPVLAEESDQRHVFGLGGLEILHPWANATRHDHAALFMEVHNEGAEVVEILGARLPEGAEGQIVGFRMKAGEMGFDPLPAIPVAPGGHIDFAPDGLAIRFDGLTAPLVEGGHWDVILRTSAGDIALEVMIEPEDARAHSHANHAH